MNKKNLPYLYAGLFFAAGCIWLAVPGPSKFIVTTLFFLAVFLNIIAAQKFKK